MLWKSLLQYSASQSGKVRTALWPSQQYFLRMSSSSTQQKMDVNGQTINFQKVGTGFPLLCLPGALGFIESDFGSLIPKFPVNKYTFVVWDPPGYGKSRPPNRDFSGGAKFFYRDAETANEFMKKLGFSSYGCLGWSDGGITALIMAGKYPSVEKLIVWGANSYVGAEDVKLYKKVADIDKWSDKMKAPMISMYGEEYFRKLWTEWINTLLEIYEKDGGDLCKSLLPDIKCPTLIIHGMKDPMVPNEHPQHLHQQIKHSILHNMPDAKHNLHLRYPEEFLGLVDKFLTTGAL